MDNLALRIEQLAKATIRLEHMLSKLDYARSHNKTIDENDLLAYRDSVIKRFEICFDLTWKCLKFFLEKQYTVEISSPKKVFSRML